MQFKGTREQIQARLGHVAKEGTWREVSPAQLQLKHSSGAIVNWYPSTGKIVIQGRKSSIPKLAEEVRAALQLSSTIGAPSALTASANAAASKETRTETKPVVTTNQSLYKLDIDSELVIGLVAAVGTDLEHVKRILEERLRIFEYTAQEIRISNDIIAALVDIPSGDHYARIDALMTAGNDIRSKTGDKAFLAKAAAAKINQIRSNETGEKELAPLRRRAFIVNSLKQPDEVQALRKIYSNGFFLIGVHSSEARRSDYLHRNKDISLENVDHLIKRDVDESEPFGQHTRDTYHLSDFFINYDGNMDRLQHDLWRILDLIFGKPFVTPTFDEFAMFMAFSASLRSADLSRQVGAVITRNNAIVATGANDVPKFGGGQYWPQYQGNEIEDVSRGRDYMRGGDSNVQERRDIIEDIVQLFPVDQQGQKREILNKGKLKNITEYGRVVHAEMEALLSCARESIGTRDSWLYCTTFPCHNCAKHIIAAGVRRVIYVEPYPKSKALDFHDDAITLEPVGPSAKLVFEPFVGVGPRSFFNLFSTSLGSGYPITRKNSNGEVVDWDQHAGRLRMQMLPTSYIERETSVADEVNELVEKLNGQQS